MTNEPQSPRSSSGRPGAPAGSTVAIVIAAVAVLLGLFVLKKFSDDDETVNTTPTTKPPAGVTTLPGSTGTTKPASPGTSAVAVPDKPNKDVKLIVANASGTGGAAAKLSAILTKAGFTTIKATNATGAKIDTSIVYYDTTMPGARENALFAAKTMGLPATAVKSMPAKIPTTEAKLEDGTGVLVLLGLDKAGKTAEQMSGSAKPTTSTA